MIITKMVGLLSAALGALGTLFLFFGSFAYEQPPVYFNQEMAEALGKRNKRRQTFQRVGLGFLMLSFLLAGLSVILG